MPTNREHFEQTDEQEEEITELKELIESGVTGRFTNITRLDIVNGIIVGVEVE